VSPSRPVSPSFLRTVRGSHAIAVEARICPTFQTGTSPDGVDISVLDGAVEMDGTADIRSTVDLLTDGTRKWPRRASDLSAPVGNEAFVRRGVVLTGGTVEWVSLGYHRVNTAEQSEPPDGPIRIEAADRMAGIIDARLLAPVQFASSVTYGSVVEQLVTEVYPLATIEWDDGTESDTLGRSVIAEEDRHGFINDLVKARGKTWYWDHRGVLVIKDPPDPGAPVFTVNAGAGGVLVSMSRRLTREGVYNAVVASGEAGDTETPVRAVAIDANPNSPTHFYGRFGPVPMFYCMDMNTEALTRTGWKTHDQIREGEDVLTLNVDGGFAEWQPVQAVNAYHVEDYPMISMEARGHSSLSTPNHRWPVESYHANRNEWSGGQRWRETSDLRRHNRLYAAAPVANLPQEPKWSDAFVELVAWYWTEGTDHYWDGRWTGGVTIYQSARANPENCARIRACLVALFGPAVSALDGAGNPGMPGYPQWREMIPGKNDIIHFRLNRHAGRLLGAVAPSKTPEPSFISSLTASQLRLFWATSVDADGTRRGRSESVSQKRRAALDALQMACILAGMRTNLFLNKGGRCEMWQLAAHCSPRAHMTSMMRGTQTYTGTVWCPTTPNGTWLARRNGTVYYTGNSSPFLKNASQASTAAAAILRQQLGLPYSVDLSMVPNVALEPGDPVGISYSDRDGSEVHVLERLGVPLTPEHPMTASTREQTVVLIGHVA
jgi:hypothetical protein